MLGEKDERRGDLQNYPRVESREGEEAAAGVCSRVVLLSGIGRRRALTN